jgi:hypothetical protein
MERATDKFWNITDGTNVNCLKTASNPRDVCTIKATIFRRVRETAKNDYELRHICPSVWNNSTPTGRIFVNSRTLRKCAEKKIQVSVKSDKNNGHFTRRFTYFYHTPLNSPSKWEIFRRNLQINITTHFILNIAFQESCRLWHNVEKIQYALLLKPHDITSYVHFLSCLKSLSSSIFYRALRLLYSEPWCCVVR